MLPQSSLQSTHNLNFIGAPYHPLWADKTRTYFQSNSVVNYLCNYDFTRIGEYKYFLDIRSSKTVVSYEYPEPFELGKNERYYPIINDENLAL